MTTIFSNASPLGAPKPLDTAGGAQAKTAGGAAVADAAKAHEAGASVGGAFAAADAATVRPKLYDALQSILSEPYGAKSESAAALSNQIRDADVADEVIGLAKSQILSQSGPSALGQANKDAQAVLGLLR